MHDPTTYQRVDDEDYADERSPTYGLQDNSELTLKTNEGRVISVNNYNNGDENTEEGGLPTDRKRYVVMRPTDNEYSNRVRWVDQGFGQCSESCAAGRWRFFAARRTRLLLKSLLLKNKIKFKLNK